MSKEEDSITTGEVEVSDAQIMAEEKRKKAFDVAPWQNRSARRNQAAPAETSTPVNEMPDQQPRVLQPPVRPVCGAWYNPDELFRYNDDLVDYQRYAASTQVPDGTEQKGRRGGYHRRRRPLDYRYSG